MNIMRALLKVPADIFATLSELKYNYEYAKKYRDAKCIYVMGNEMWFLPAKLSPDLAKVYPMNLNRQFSVEGQYTLRPNNVPCFILFDKNQRSIKLGDKPKKVHVRKPQKYIIESKDKKNNPVIIEQVRLEDYEIQGGKELSIDGYRWSKTNVLRWLEPHVSNQRLIATAIISFLVGIIITLGYLGV